MLVHGLHQQNVRAGKLKAITDILSENKTDIILPIPSFFPTVVATWFAIF